MMVATTMRLLQLKYFAWHESKYTFLYMDMVSVEVRLFLHRGYVSFWRDERERRFPGQ